jgi:hypothetical protein
MPRLVDLKKIGAISSSEVSTMVAAIRGDSGSILWTAEMRAATRGGKCTRVEETSDSE